jgi:hypothetical protein
MMMLLQVQADDGVNNDDVVVGQIDQDGNAIVVKVDDIWHCDGPPKGKRQQPEQRNFVISNTFFDLECDSTTLEWNLEKMTTDYGDLESNPDTSPMCEEVVRLLKESIDADLPPMTLNQLIVELVTDGLEPCVLWEILFGQLTALADIVPDTTSTTATTTTGSGSNGGGTY